MRALVLALALVAMITCSPTSDRSDPATEGDGGFAPVCAEGPENTPEACIDVCDNDRDGFVDCLDHECDALCL